MPDLTIVLDLPPEEAARRFKGENWKADRLERERADFHRRVREAYLQLSGEEPERVKIIDGRGTVETIAVQIRAVVDRLIERT
jgi:dTMP kinase